MIICLDLDDTLSNTAETILDYAVRYDKEVLKRHGKIDSKIKSKDYFYFATMLNWDDKMTISFFKDNYPFYLEKIKAKSYAKKFTEKLKQMGFAIHIVTARPKNEFFDVEKITKKWLENNSITYDKLLINKKNKEEYISSVNCKIFVDDSIENCEKVKMLEKNIKVYLINTSYNKFEKKPGIIRVNNLEELYEDIKKNFDNYHY